MAQSVKSLLHERENLSVIPKPHVVNVRCDSACITSSGVEETEEFLGLSG